MHDEQDTLNKAETRQFYEEAVERTFTNPSGTVWNAAASTS
eukprot:COSAG06_NODE_26507_length_613_cov_1.143969_1_plen_40_part_10